MSTSVLVADGDSDTRKSMTETLEEADYQVFPTGSGQAALDQLETEEIGLVIAATDLPGENGFAVLSQMETISPNTLGILTTEYPSIEAVVEAIHLRAHDYLIKPIDPQDLLSSVASGMARLEEGKRKEMVFGQLENSLAQFKEIVGATGVQKTYDQVIQLPDGVNVDFTRGTMWRGDLSAHLSPTESKLLKIFLENWGQVLPHKKLAYLIKGYEVEEGTEGEVLRPLVSRLRSKLDTFPNGKRWVSSVRGKGYTFDPEKPMRIT